MAKRSVKEEMEYIRSVPKAVPPGKVLVHNHVYPDGKKASGLGGNGSRAWLQEGKAGCVICDCGFAPGVTHYRLEHGPKKTGQ